MYNASILLLYSSILNLQFEKWMHLKPKRMVFLLNNVWLVGMAIKCFTMSARLYLFNRLFLEAVANKLIDNSSKC